MKCINHLLDSFGISFSFHYLYNIRYDTRKRTLRYFYALLITEQPLVHSESHSFKEMAKRITNGIYVAFKKPLG